MKELLEAFLNSTADTLTVSETLKNGVVLTQSWDKAGAKVTLGYLISEQEKVERQRIELEALQQKLETLNRLSGIVTFRQSVSADLQAARQASSNIVEQFKLARALA